MGARFISPFKYIHLYTIRSLNMAKKNVTLSLDEEIYENYRTFCEKNAIALSRSVEIFMEMELSQKNHNRGKK